LSESKEIRAMLEMLVKERQGAPGVHLTGEDLVAYHRGKLEPAAANALQDHLVACADCRLLLSDLMAFPELPEPPGPTPDLPLADVDAAWSKMKARIFAAAAGPEPSPEEESARIRPGPWTRNAQARVGKRRDEERPEPVRFLALAASFLLGCVGLSFWVYTLRLQIGELSRPQLNVAIHDLFAADDPVRGGQAATAVSERRGPGQMTLILHLSEPPAAPLAIRILDASDRELWSAEGLEAGADGTTSLSIRRDFFPAGVFRIVILASENGHRRTVEVFQLSVGN